MDTARHQLLRNYQSTTRTYSGPTYRLTMNFALKRIITGRRGE